MKHSIIFVTKTEQIIVSYVCLLVLAVCLYVVYVKTWDSLHIIISSKSLLQFVGCFTLGSLAGVVLQLLLLKGVYRIAFRFSSNSFSIIPNIHLINSVSVGSLRTILVLPFICFGVFPIMWGWQETSYFLLLLGIGWTAGFSGNLIWIWRLRHLSSSVQVDEQINSSLITNASTKKTERTPDVY